MTSSNLQSRISNSLLPNTAKALLLPVALAILAFLLRLAPMGRYVTPDEPAWVYRSTSFAGALATRDWAAVPSPGHPGVTTMWLGAAGVAAGHLSDPAESAAHLDWLNRLAWLSPENDEMFRRLAFFLPWGRAAVALVTSLGVAALYPLLARLLDRRAALLAAGLLAFDPFLAGHSALLHTDALLATFTLLALATALNGLHEPHRISWWLLSGLFTGLALLTKTPAVVLLPTVASIRIVAAARRWRTANGRLEMAELGSLFAHVSSFLLVAAAACFALYPALWADPAATFDTLLAFTGRHVETALRPVFFLGQTTHDPGLAYYPVVLFVRASPLALAGLAAGLAVLRRLPADRRFAFLALLAFAIIFGASMSLGAKKHDRYLLPALPPLTVAAAIGWTHLGEQLCKRGTGERRSDPSPPSALALPLLSAHLLLPALQALIALAFLFYPLTYASPLAGGPWGASHLLWLDWGEGAGVAAHWLNQQPGAGQLAVATDAVPIVAPLFKGRTVSLDRTSLADYVVLPHGHEPAPPYPAAYTAKIGLVDHAAVYTNTAPGEQAAYLEAHAGPDDLVLLDADAPLLRRYSGPGTIATVAGLPTQAAVAEQVAKLGAGRPNFWLVADPAASPITAQHLHRSVEVVATLAAVETVGSATVTRYAARGQPVADLQPSPAATFGDQITLVDALLPAEPTSGRLVAFLRWQVAGPTPTGLHASLYLCDSAGQEWAEAGQPILDDTTFPTSAWAPGEWTDDALAVKLPEHIPPGTYEVQLAVADGTQAQLGAWGADGAFRGVRVPLGEVEIAPPARPTGPAPCAGRSLTAGPLAACAPGLPLQTVPSGDVLRLSLTWSAAAPPRADYRVRWRLSRAGSVAAEYILALSPYPTSSWREGDSFDARYGLRVDPAVPAGTYDLTLNVLGPDGHPTWPEDEVLAAAEILHRDRLFDLPDGIAHPLDLALGDTVHLRGFDLGDIQAAPGDALPLTLYWQGDGPTDIDYTVFVHLVGPDGRSHGQLDYFPGGGAAPTTSWAPGQVVIDELTLPVDADAPAGTYHVAAGMYDAASGGRLPVTDASGDRLANDQITLPIEITIAGGSQ